jgi:hypothetical protein
VKAWVAVLALALPNAPADFRLITSCDEVARPELARVIEFDPTPAVYALPESNEPYDGIEFVDGGIRYSFIDQGESVPVLCPGSDTVSYQMRTFKRIASSAFPRCWKEVVETERIGDCTAVPSLYDPSPDDAPTPDIDPEFDEHSPEGPGPGPPGAEPVDG